MDLICVTVNTDNYMQGWATNEDQYLHIEVFKGKDVVIRRELPKHEYDSYEHFAGVIGKFDETAFFFRESILIETENFDGVKAAYNKQVKKHGEPYDS